MSSIGHAFDRSLIAAESARYDGTYPATDTGHGEDEAIAASRAARGVGLGSGVEQHCPIFRAASAAYMAADDALRVADATAERVAARAARSKALADMEAARDAARSVH